MVQQSDDTARAIGSDARRNEFTEDTAQAEQKQDTVMDRAGEEKRDEGWRPSDKDDRHASPETDPKTDPGQTAMGSEATGQTSILDDDDKQTNSF